MKPTQLLASLLFVTQIGILPSLRAQQNDAPQFPAPSPACTLKQRIGLTDFEINYSRPGVKGREIFGGLVPYGQVWRTGANQATTISFNTPIKFGGTEVPAGKYGLFTIPGESEWTVILNKNAQQWGSYNYKESDDVVRVKVPAVSMQEKIETFTIEFSRLEDESALLDLIWDHTVVPIRLQWDLTSKLLPQIQQFMSSAAKKDPGQYYQAAQFYFNHDQDLGQALKWLNTGLEDKPRIAFELLNLKARILAKQGDKAGAIAAAKESSESAVKFEGQNSSWVKMNNDLIASLQ